MATMATMMTVAAAERTVLTKTMAAAATVAAAV
jgi:hypothetical protein